MSLAVRAGKTLGAEVHAANAGGLVDDRAEREIEIARLEQPRVPTPGAGNDLERDTRSLARGRVEKRRKKECCEEVGGGNHEATFCGPWIERGSPPE